MLIYDSLTDLAQNISEPKDFVSKALVLLEAGFRGLALQALADWQKTQIASDRLFDSISLLERPSWGAWNGLLDGLKNARKQTLGSANEPLRLKVEKASLLSSILNKRESRVAGFVSDQLTETEKHIRYTFTEKTRLKKLMELPIAIRNMVAHQDPDEQWWVWADETLKVCYEELHRLQCLEPIGGEYNAPWFKQQQGKLYSYNGLSNSNEAIYVRPNESAIYDDAKASDILESFKDLLGQNSIEKEAFKLLIQKSRPEERTGVILGGFLLHKPIGEGGFATVYLATQLSTSRKVAVKVLKDGMDEDTRERFRNEARHLASFYDNENIVDVIGFGESSWRKPSRSEQAKIEWFEEFSKGAAVKSYIGMEWVDGVSLNQLFAEKHSSERSSMTSLVDYFSQTALALTAVHANGLIHRDIKPDNIMLDDKGVIKVMDFGIARNDDENRSLRTLTGLQPGSPAYMSPEQLRAKDADAEVGKSTDIYSLGATFYELFTGARLYDHDSQSALEVNTLKLSQVRPKVPKSLNSKIPWEINTLLEGCLQCEIQDRIVSSQALRLDLQRYTDNEVITYRKPNLARRVSLAYRRNNTLFKMTAGFVTILAVGSLVYFNHLQTKEKQLVKKNAELEKVSSAREKANIELQTALTEVKASEAKAIASSKALTGGIAGVAFFANYSSGNIEIKELSGNLLDRSVKHLRPSFYPSSLEDSLNSVILCMLIANNETTKSSANLLLDEEDYKYLDTGIIETYSKKGIEIIERILSSTWPNEKKFNPVVKNYLKGTKLGLEANSAIVDLNTKKYEKAIKGFKNAIRYHEQSLVDGTMERELVLMDLSQMYWNLTHAYRKLGDEANARASWHKTLQLQNEQYKIRPTDNTLLQLWTRTALGLQWKFLPKDPYQKRLEQSKQTLKIKGLFTKELRELEKELIKGEFLKL